ESSADMRGAHATVRAIETSTTAAYEGAGRVSPSPMAPGVATVRARIAMLPAATTTFSMTQPTAARKGVTARPGRNIDAVRSIVPMRVEKPSTWRASRATTKIPATRRACRRRTPLVHEEKWVVDRARALSIDTVHHLFLRGVTWLIDPDDAGWGTHDDGAGGDRAHDQGIGADHGSGSDLHRAEDLRPVHDLAAVADGRKSILLGIVEPARPDVRSGQQRDVPADPRAAAETREDGVWHDEARADPGARRHLGAKDQEVEQKEDPGDGKQPGPMAGDGQTKNDHRPEARLSEHVEMAAQRGRPRALQGDEGLVVRADQVPEREALAQVQRHRARRFGPFPSHGRAPRGTAPVRGPPGKTPTARAPGPPGR